MCRPPFVVQPHGISRRRRGTRAARSPTGMASRCRPWRLFVACTFLNYSPRCQRFKNAWRLTGLSAAVQGRVDVLPRLAASTVRGRMMATRRDLAPLNPCHRMPLPQPRPRLCRLLAHLHSHSAQLDASHHPTPPPTMLLPSQPPCGRTKSRTSVTLATASCPASSPARRPPPSSPPPSRSCATSRSTVTPGWPAGFSRWTPAWQGLRGRRTGRAAGFTSGTRRCAGC